MAIMALRGHHLICQLGFRGMGYNQEFIDKMTEVVDLVKSNADLKIKVLNEQDVLCESCPNRLSRKCFSEIDETDDWRIKEMDNYVLHKLNLKAEEVYLVSEIVEKIKSNFSIEDLDILCQHCNWRQYGYCDEGLQTLIE